MASFNTIEVTGFKAAIDGMRLPHKSNLLSDSSEVFHCFQMGEKDYQLCQKLVKAGTEHRKFMRMIQVWVKISAPRFYWSEFDTYKIGTVANSESTMHTLLKKPITLQMFELPASIQENLYNYTLFKKYVDWLNEIREQSLNNQTNELLTLKSLLPESFIQTRMINLNYETLSNMYHQRKNHRLPQWRIDFVEWVHTLPYYQLITLEF